jgi:hypothetical protein
MLFWSDFGVRSQKMMEDMKENQNMLFVTTRLSGADVISNHIPDSIQAVRLLMHEIRGKRGSAISGTGSCSAIASTSCSVRPHKATQSSRVIMNQSV